MQIFRVTTHAYATEDRHFASRAEADDYLYGTVVGCPEFHRASLTRFDIGINRTTVLGLLDGGGGHEVNQTPLVEWVNDPVEGWILEKGR